MQASLTNALLFLINTIFDLYLFILMIRLLLARASADYFNPFTQFIVKTTNFLVLPLRRIFPNYRRIEIATLLLLWIIASIKFLLIAILSMDLPNLLGLFLLAASEVLKILIQTFFYAILLQAILSWIQPYSPINQVLMQISAPVLRPLQRWVPPIAGFDITPIPALILLQLISLVVVNPMMIAFVNLTFK